MSTALKIAQSNRPSRGGVATFVEAPADLGRDWRDPARGEESPFLIASTWGRYGGAFKVTDGCSTSRLGGAAWTRRLGSPRGARAARR